MPDPIVIAIPKGRILKELHPLMDALGLKPAESFYNEDSRELQFATNIPHISIIRVRSFDVPTFVAFGAAQLGVAGSDVLMEFDYPEIYAPLDLNIGHCRLSLAAPETAMNEARQLVSHVKIATKYPAITARYFAAKGIQAECIKLNGAMELAPKLGLAERIVDLVSSGATLKANGLVEVEKITDVSSRLIVNRTAYKTRGAELASLVEKCREAVHGA